jgi:hypothetical protein
MQFNTVESSADYVFKGLLQQLHKNWKKRQTAWGSRHFTPEERAITFDQYLWDNLEELGHAAYEFIGEYFGDADSAADDLGLGE